MAIVQISRITNRKGLQENLPQLAGAELGWSIDERRLFIGNGTLEEGAPVIGNTEILTEFSDILAFQTNYTYKGEAAGYIVQTGPSPSTPITQSLQTWLDQFATVKDFGAVGDGVTDDTAAINRALYELFCRETNPQIRRSLFFPAGVYLVTESILIPPYATLYGEGVDNSVITLSAFPDDSSTVTCVAQTSDSLQQTGVNIGLNGATAPQYITVNNLGFKNLNVSTHVFIVDSAVDCKFQNVSFVGARDEDQLINTIDESIGVAFSSSYRNPSQLVFDDCIFTNTTFGLHTDNTVSGVTVTNSKLDTLYQGIALGTGVVVGTGATGFRITNNRFDNIYSQGIVFGDVQLNASGYNIFYDVGNHFSGTTNPATSVIDIQSNNNVSIGDMFERSDAYAGTYSRVDVNNTTSIGIENSSKVQIGSYIRQSGTQASIFDNTASPSTIATISSPSFSINYSIARGVVYRTGTIVVTFNPAGSNLQYTDDYTENAASGIVLTVSQSGTDAVLQYTSTSTGTAGTIYYSINRFY